MITNHYQILGLKRSASNPDIKQAYRKLAVKFHPDKNKGDKFFEERFKEIQESYEILSNSQQKKEYDKIYDSYFTTNRNKDYNQSNKGYKRSYSNSEKREEQERKSKEKVERRRKSEIKKNVELAFEDKAWIFIVNLTILGSLIGLVMFIKYVIEGYKKKSYQTCGVSLLGIVIGLVLAVILVALEIG